MHATFQQSEKLTATAPRNMALGQLYTNQVLNQELLALLTQMPRQAFVPAALQGAAYVDDDLNIGHGRILMEPLIFARLIALAEPTLQDRALVLASAYGYAAAVLAKLCEQVTACEPVKEMAADAVKRLAGLGIKNVESVSPPSLADGYTNAAPYDIIFINGAIEFLPPALIDQLAEGGRLVAVQYFPPKAGLASRVGKIVQYRKINGALFCKETADAGSPLLVEFRQPKAFLL